MMKTGSRFAHILGKGSGKFISPVFLMSLNLLTCSDTQIPSRLSRPFIPYILAPFHPNPSSIHKVISI